MRLTLILLALLFVVAVFVLRARVERKRRAALDAERRAAERRYQRELRKIAERKR